MLFEGAQKNVVWRTMTAAEAAPAWTSRHVAAMMQSHVCAMLNQRWWSVGVCQLFDILSMATKKKTENIYFNQKDKIPGKKNKPTKRKKLSQKNRK